MRIIIIILYFSTYFYMWNHTFNCTKILETVCIILTLVSVVRDYVKKWPFWHRVVEREDSSAVLKGQKVSFVP